MSKKPESPKDRLKKIPLWQWGMITIIAGLATNLVSFQATPASAAAARGQALGRGAATLLFVLIGVGLIVAHFVKRSRKN